MWVLSAFLLTCRHVCAVLKDVKYYEHSLFHIRWHTCFNYYDGNAFTTRIAPKINEALNNTLNETRSTNYHDSGKYKGMPLRNSKSMHELPEFFHECIDKDIIEN